LIHGDPQVKADHRVRAGLQGCRVKLEHWELKASRALLDSRVTMAVRDLRAL